jgi:hypothetical protein
VAESRGGLEQIGGEAALRVAKRLDGLLQQAEAIEARLQAQTGTAESLAATTERTFQLLDARLAHSTGNSKASLDQLATRIQEVNDLLGTIADPMRNAKDATGQLTEAVSALRESAMQTVDVLGETLPARTVTASQAAETMTGDLAALVAAIDAAHEKAQSLASPISESREALLAATQGYAAQRDAIEAAGQALVVELEQARQLIAEVEEQTQATSLAAATRLVEAMGRVREVATQATGTMRDMLDGIIGEARESLKEAAGEAMRQSFVEPIAESARAAEEAARSAAERSAASMTALAGTLQLLDQRSHERSTAIEDAGQRDLLAAAALLTDRLASAALSISSALGKPMSDADWTAWRHGERGLFNRRALALLEKREAKALKAELTVNSDLAEAARRYTAEFDALLKRIDPGGGSAISAALLSSDQGRLAAALTEALDR